MTGGDVPGRRNQKEKRDAPGHGIGALGTSGATGKVPGPAEQVPRAPMGPRGVQRSPTSTDEGHKEVETIAPVPSRPPLYPPDSKYYQVPITFEVELLDRFAPKQPAQTAGRTAAGEGGA